VSNDTVQYDAKFKDKSWYKEYNGQVWYAIYRELELPSEFKSIKFNNETVDCNPARCNNPSMCRIPHCKGIQKSVSSSTYQKAHHLPTFARRYLRSKSGINFNGGCGPMGCGLEEKFTIIPDGYPTKENGWNAFFMRQGATRFGVNVPPQYTAGLTYCYPQPTASNSLGSTGSWLAPGAANCNPLGFLVCTKASVGHTGLPLQSDEMQRRAALLFVKTTWCIDGVKCKLNPGQTKCPAKCYTSKRGECLTFTEKLSKLTKKGKAVLPKALTSMTKEHSGRAVEELKAGRFKRGCTAEATKAATNLMAGN